MTTGCRGNACATSSPSSRNSLSRRTFDFRGITVVEFGCGGLNPLSQLLVYVMLGAEKAVGIDMDSIQDPQIAAIALYRTASWMLTDPQSIVGQRPVPEPGAMIRNIRGIDLPALATGDLAEGLAWS